MSLSLLDQNTACVCVCVLNNSGFRIFSVWSSANTCDGGMGASEQIEETVSIKFCRIVFKIIAQKCDYLSGDSSRFLRMSHRGPRLFSTEVV